MLPVMAATLEQRLFGNTGEKVTVIGLGGAFVYKHSFEQGVETVKHALELGVNYFDTSPAYGRMRDGKWISRGESQLIMGEGLDGSTKPHLLATKLHKCSSVEDFRAQIQDNLHALRRDKVDVLQAHDVESTPEEIEESVMAAQAGPLPSDLVRSLEELGSNTGYYENLVG